MKRFLALSILQFSICTVLAQSAETFFKWDLSVSYRFESWNVTRPRS